MTDGRGADVAFEVCGQAEAVENALETLRTGGRYLIAGMVMPGRQFTLEGNQVTRKTLAIKGIHNYRGDHLGKSLEFLAAFASSYPYDEIVGRTFPLEKINDAVAEAAKGESIRIAVRPG
jgi:threonine dehydrogenase-like Zn-dependent dehydrogenase